MVPPRPIRVLALVALAISTLACRDRTGPPPAARAEPAAPAAVEAQPRTPPADPQPAAPDPDRLGADGGYEVRFGLALAADGAVVDPVLSFASGDPVCVSVLPGEGVRASRVELAWFDDDGNELGRSSVDFGGSPPRAGLCLPGAANLARRTYRLDLTVDGGQADSAQFTIGDLRQSASSGGA
jgi:hypothetical protein